MAKPNYEDFSKEALIKEIKRLRKRKKYGLVWEDKPEDIVEQHKHELPVLNEAKDKSVITDSNMPTHILIEGDNYHTLSVLNYTHKGKIDVIYIDPPYNTGNKSWKYNNHYVDKEDVFKHSKFMSFLNKRIRLAKNLLSKEGIIICAIDDYEIHNVRHLFDEVFGEVNRLGTMAVVHNPGGRQDDSFFATAHEYMLVYAKSKPIATVGHLEVSAKKLAQFKHTDRWGEYKLRDYMRSGSNSLPQDRPNLYYPIYVNPESLVLSTKKRVGWVELLPIDSKGVTRVWRWKKDSFLRDKKKYIQVKKTKDGFSLYAKERLSDHQGKKPKTFWNESYYSTATGTDDLKNVLGPMFKGGEKIFDFPKSKFLVRDILSITSRQNSVILDFFAGSGTTGQAVIELNKIDGGKRQFILCTDNQDNNGSGTKIASDICYPRIKRVITGYSANDIKITGLNNNLRYYSSTFVKNVKTDNDKRNLASKSTELICLAEETFEEVVSEKNSFSIFENQKRMTGIIYDEDAIADFKKELRKHKKPIIVYVFSYDHTYDEEEFENIETIKAVKTIPEAILNIYRRIYK